MEAIILAGGKGTRLQSVVSDVPKSMASVAGKPFLYYLLRSLEEAGFRHIILAVGYKYEVIERWLSTYETSLRLSLVVEEEPLGTGGAVKFSLCQAEEPDVFIVNGDTYLGVDYARMLAFHQETQAEATLALKPMKDFDRYGAVDLHPDSRILRFREKQYEASGLINAGVYLIKREALRNYPDRFSLEKEYFEKRVDTCHLAGFPSEVYFIDIGVPEDYAKAEIDFADGKYKTL
ncbi:D-mannose-1-phosphate guanyltransferase [Parabacteroides sp. 52]|uniref:nucleotidyltransferase family protein n=1 Tax=unclassified Parabacteroides TaxID=2649774 RepID=UPI0013D42D31|nr:MULTISPECIES: nucleotidyltransferase family protein [unclassified Parabacteroides]MDH6535174.1 D-glycero-alpha-D-manno-heptose 1-phosphate guanylyltransferase [Parabacteroides sp. PM5-20]NDV56213.1 D-mannose-1-phosphate guanyltransferase [Parabacteroides sp. 52]